MCNAKLNEISSASVTLILQSSHSPPKTGNEYQGHDMIPLSLWSRACKIFCLAILDDGERWQQQKRRRKKTSESWIRYDGKARSALRAFGEATRKPLVTNAHGQLTTITNNNKQTNKQRRRNIPNFSDSINWEALPGSVSDYMQPFQWCNGKEMYYKQLFINVAGIFRSVSFLLVALKQFKNSMSKL